MAGLVSFAEAIEIVRTHSEGLPRPGCERVELLASRNRVLAQDIRADRDQPPFDRSTRDGFAVRAAEWSPGRELHIAGQVRAGESWTGGPLPAESAIEIMTGAPLPAGADAVAMVEHAEVSGGLVSAQPGRFLTAGENVVPRGAEAAAGSVVVPAGTVMRAAEIAVAATCGKAELNVNLRPEVAIAATGDELTGLEDTPEPHQIRNSNSYGLAALVESAGGRARVLAVARDVTSDIRERIAQGRTADLLILSGGVSAGKYDLVEEVLGELGAEFLFTGVGMQPGKPLVFGRIPGTKQAGSRAPERDRFFFGLPGNPVSTQVTFHCFVEPFVRVLAGAAWTGPRFAQATLAQHVAPRSGLTRVLPAHLTGGVERTEVRIVPWQGSGDLAANARANCYAVLPDGRELKPGEVVSVLLR